MSKKALTCPKNRRNSCKTRRLAHGFVHGYLWEPTSRGGITLNLAKNFNQTK
jgi:hypothetical protein